MRLFSFVLSFCETKTLFNENLSFTDYASRIRCPDCSKLARNWQKYNGVTICQLDAIINFFMIFVSLPKFSYWSKIPVNMSTGSGVITIFFYKGLTRKPEIRNTPFYVATYNTFWESWFLFLAIMI